jgi:hypothetical protein
MPAEEDEEYRDASVGQVASLLDGRFRADNFALPLSVFGYLITALADKGYRNREQKLRDKSFGFEVNVTVAWLGEVFEGSESRRLCLLQIPKPAFDKPTRDDARRISYLMTIIDEFARRLGSPMPVLILSSGLDEPKIGFKRKMRKWSEGEIRVSFVSWRHIKELEDESHRLETIELILEEFAEP